MSAKERFLQLIPRLTEEQAQAALDAVADLRRAEALLGKLREADPHASSAELLGQLFAHGIDAETIRFLREREGHGPPKSCPSRSLGKERDR